MAQRRALIVCTIGCLLLLLARGALAQSRPFPQQSGYSNGVATAALSSSDAQSSYTAWKKNHLVADCGTGYYRVDNGQGDGTSFSEGMGYGMLLTAYFGDRTEFDGLWAFVKKNFNLSGLTGWHVNCAGFTASDGGNGSATDGDTDVGFALVVAVDQWGEAYRQPALDYLQSLKAHDYTTCSATGRAMATNGDWDTGCTSENTSYFMPAYYRVFARFTSDPFWSNAADSALTIWSANANAETGLIANEVNQNGGLGTSSENYVDYNGCRVPWRAVLEYLWHGTPGARQVAGKMASWVTSIGIDKLVDGYNTDGSVRGQYTQLNAWVGGFASSAMATDQATLTTFASDFKAIDNDNGGYYGASLRSLYLLMMTGNEWEPALPGSGGATNGGAAGTAGAGAGGTTSIGGSLSSGGTTTSGGGAGVSAAGTLADTTTPPSQETKSGCGCRTAQASPASTAYCLFVGLVWLYGARRFRRRR